MYWILFFVLGCLVTLLIDHYLTMAFKGSNMVNIDPIHKNYEVYDRRGNSVLVPLKKGVLLSLYNVITSLAIIAFLITAIVVSHKWWLPIVLLIGCEILIRIPSFFTKISYGSFIYYLYLIASPILIVLSFITLFK